MCVCVCVCCGGGRGARTVVLWRLLWSQDGLNIDGDEWRARCAGLDAVGSDGRRSRPSRRA